MIVYGVHRSLVVMYTHTRHGWIVDHMEQVRALPVLCSQETMAKHRRQYVGNVTSQCQGHAQGLDNWSWCACVGR